MSLKYLQTYRSKQTKRAYRYAVKLYLNSARTTLEKYFNEERNCEADVEKFFTEINSRPPKTINLLLSAVKTFLIENGVELPQRFWRSIRRRVKGSRARTIDNIPSNTELKKILLYMPIQWKALYTVLASSGMRIGEALQLKLNDLDLTSQPAKITIRGEYAKSGNPRVTYISDEAKNKFLEIFECSWYIAKSTNLKRYLDSEWNQTIPKIIDNAIIFKITKSS